MKFWRQKTVQAICAAGAILAASTGGAHAEEIVYDFDSGFDELIYTDADYPLWIGARQGSGRFSANCHIDRQPGPDDVTGYDGSSWIAWDASGCYIDGQYNENFLGPEEYQAPDTSEAVLYFDLSGIKFSLESLYFPWDSVGVASSKGGTFTFVPVDETGEDTQRQVAFSGGEWSGIDWLLFTDLARAGAPASGIDQLVINAPGPLARVPEPSTGALGLTGFLTLLWAGRRAAARRTEPQ